MTRLIFYSLPNPKILFRNRCGRPNLVSQMVCVTVETVGADNVHASKVAYPGARM